MLNIAEPAIQFSDDDGRDQKISLETFAQKTDISNSLNDVEIRFAPGTPYKQIFRERETLKQLKDYILKYQERDTSEL